jgi:hypothetical protein
MPSRAASHLSTERDAAVAGYEVANAALDSLGGHADLALLFATTGYDQQTLLDTVRQRVGTQCVIAGCSGEGVIARGESQEQERAASVMLVALDDARAETLLVNGYGADPEGAARSLARSVGSANDVAGLLVFPDGLVGDCSRFLHTLGGALPGVTIVGGTAGDAMTFERTYQYGGDLVRSESVSAVVLRGSGELRVAVSHGCTPCGPHQTITRLDGSWVQEIDGRAAWDVFREFLDGDPQDLNADGIVHLCIGTSANPEVKFVADPMVIRTPLALDKETGGLLFPGGGLWQGQRIRITRRDAQRIRQGAASCARELRGPEGSPLPAFMLQFDCAGRGKAMFGACAADEIIAPLRSEFGPELPWAGFHTYGEIAETQGSLRYHNYTVALCAYYDT